MARFPGIHSPKRSHLFELADVSHHRASVFRKPFREIIVGDVRITRDQFEYARLNLVQDVR